jgi:The ARF-like 2 binding protein BART
VSLSLLTVVQAAAFDRIIGALQEVLLDESFSSKQQAFLNEHCSEFEDTEENQLSYTGIFTQYTDMIGESMQSIIACSKSPAFYSFHAHTRFLVLLRYFPFFAETLLAENLAARIPGFTMESFSEMLATRPEEVSTALVSH